MVESTNLINVFKRAYTVMRGAQWYESNTVYQILEVKNPPKQGREEEKNICTTIVAKERGSGWQDTPQEEEKNFDGDFLDSETISNLQKHSKIGRGNGNTISSYLPSPGVIFSQGFINTLSDPKNKEFEQIEITNFYHPMRTLLYSRKISQLISKTWWSYLEAQKNGGEIWKNFIHGEWNKIIESNNISTESNISGLDILDGLIAREIFLFGGADSPDKPDPNPQKNYYSLLKEPSNDTGQAEFLIFPNNRAWQGIILSLLLAGQAYYKRTDKYSDKYHQISQPIFSTGEITMLHSLEVDWGKFHGDIQEIIIRHDKPWVGYHIVLPYPPIPDYADPDAIKKWGWAKEEYSENVPQEERHFPFYKKDNDKYLIDVEYFKPPYPYIPLSCS
jgi:hypothetical protein